MNFNYSINPFLHLDYQRGGLDADELTRLLAEQSYYDREGFKLGFEKGKEAEFVAELTRELIEKTVKCEGEEPWLIQFFFVPSIFIDEDCYVLCALTKVDNNGSVNIFAPRKEYLELYQRVFWGSNVYESTIQEWESDDSN